MSRGYIHHTPYMDFPGEDAFEYSSEHTPFDENKQASFLKEQTQCPLCEGHLHILVEYEKEGYMLKEEGRCSQCMALSINAQHTLH